MLSPLNRKLKMTVDANQHDIVVDIAFTDCELISGQNLRLIESQVMLLKFSFHGSTSYFSPKGSLNHIFHCRQLKPNPVWLSYRWWCYHIPFNHSITESHLQATYSWCSAKTKLSLIGSQMMAFMRINDQLQWLSQRICSRPLATVHPVTQFIFWFTHITWIGRAAYTPAIWFIQSVFLFCGRSPPE